MIRLEHVTLELSVQPREESHLETVLVGLESVVFVSDILHFKRFF